MNTAKPSAEQTLMEMLASRSDASAVELATGASIGGSTAAKTLAKLEAAGPAQRTPGSRSKGRRLPDRWSLVSRTKKSAGQEGATTVERLRPGQLNELVLDYMREHASDDPLGPTVVAKGLGRSSGAVAN